LCFIGLLLQNEKEELEEKEVSEISKAACILFAKIFSPSEFKVSFKRKNYAANIFNLLFFVKT